MPNRIKVVTDACCHVPDAHQKGRAGRGYCASGVLVLDNDENELERSGEYLGEMTVPESEYNAIIYGLDRASNHCREEVEVWSDSQLVIKHLNKEWKLKAENLKSLYDKVKTLELRYTRVRYFHHPREAPLARIADEIANSVYKKHRP